MDFHETPDARSRETIDLLRRGASHLASDAPTPKELERMLGGVEQGTPRRFPVPVVAAAALLLLAVPAGLLLFGSPAQQQPAEPEPVAEKEADLEAFMEAGRTAMREMRFADAADKFRAVIDACATEEQTRRYAFPARMEVGECLYRQEKYREAYEAYDRLVREAREAAPKIAADAAYYRYRSAFSRLGGKRDPESRALRDQARNAFMDEFPDHPRAVDLFYYRGADLIAAADARGAKGDVPGANALYREAISKGLSRVKRSSILYEKAKAREGEALYKLGRFQEALALFLKVHGGELVRKTTDREHLVNQASARALSAFYASRCLNWKGAWNDALEILDGFEETFKDETLRGFHPAVKLQRIRARIGLGDLKAAQAELTALEELPRTDLHAAEAALLLGKAYRKAATEAKQSGDEENWKALITAAALYYHAHATNARSPAADDLLAAGLVFEEIGDLEGAEQLLARAVTRCAEEDAGTISDRPTRKERMEAHLARVREARER